MTTQATTGPGAGSTATGLWRTCHPGPAIAVSAIAALLAVGADRPVRTVALVTLAVLAGQLTNGWANDLIDLDRDRTVGRRDKPLATGELDVGAVRLALVVAMAACVVLALTTGWRSAVVLLLLGVGSAHAYNLWLKATAMSWLPYAVAFGTLPAVASLAGSDPSWPPWWLSAAGAVLGVGAHVLNAWPDLADDARTGVRGLPHRMGERAARPVAAGLLVLASGLAALGPPGTPPVWTAGILLVVLVLACVALRGRGRTPFNAAIGIALLDVVLITGAR